MHLIWSYLFIISLAQCLFIILFLFKKHERSASLYALSGILSILFVTNLDFYIVLSGTFRYLPHLFNISLGMMFLFGPLFYFYTRSSLEAGFKWRRIYLLHFFPYLINFGLNVAFYFTDGNLKIKFVEYFLSGALELRLMDKIMITLQTVHLVAYLYWVSQSLIRKYKNTQAEGFLIPFQERLRWLNVLQRGLILYAIVIFGLLGFVLVTQTLNPQVNYLYTLLTSAGIYLIAYKSVLTPQIIVPHFQKKYKTTQPIDKKTEEECLAKLSDLMGREKVYKNPDLKADTLAKRLDISTNQLSRLINEKFSKSYTEYINEYRIKAFIDLIDSEEYFSYSLFGLATEVGFNSKTAFNNSFKKITGKTPSEFKKREK